MYRKLTIQKPLTTLEMLKIDKRIDEIDKLNDLDLDDDILENLEKELEFIYEYLTESLRITQIYEKMQQKGFKVVS